VEGATVTGEWSIAVRGTTTGNTGADGIATLISPEAKAPRNGGLVFHLTITDVQKAGYTFDGIQPTLTIAWPE
jgi:hypothetical protein